MKSINYIWILAGWFNRRLCVCPFALVPNVPSMTEIVITFLVKVEEHLFEESSGELTWDKKQIEQPIYVRSRLPKKNIIGIGLV